MIVFWKQVGTRYTTNWNGIKLVLSEDRTTKRWHLTADSRRVTTSWPTAKVAMERIDAKQQAIVMEKSRAFVAKLGGATV